MTADPAHIKAHVERGSNVETDEMHQRDRRSRGPEYFEHLAELLTTDEALGPTAQRGLRENHRAGNDHDQGEPEGKEATLRTSGTPADAEAHNVDEHQPAEQDQD